LLLFFIWKYKENKEVKNTNEMEVDKKEDNIEVKKENTENKKEDLTLSLENKGI